MKRERSQKLNSDGSALVMVIVVLLFVGILATGILSVVTDHFKSVGLIDIGNRNLYSAEEGLDEVLARLSEKADTAYRRAYADWLSNYTTMSESERERFFMDSFGAELKSILVTDVVSPVLSDPEGAADALFYGTGHDGLSLSFDGVTDPYSAVTWSLDDSGSEFLGLVKLSDLSVAFGDETYATSITTDVDFCVKYPGFTVKEKRRASVAADDLVCGDYVFITDGGVIFNGAGGTVEPGYEVTGNIYAGSGVSLKNNSTTVTMHCDRLISGKSIDVDDGASLKVTGSRLPGGGYGIADIWSSDIALRTTSDLASADPSMEVSANIYLKDDLSLDATSARFVMSGGSYLGYMAGTEDTGSGEAAITGRADGSSAIIVNGTNATLDLRGAQDIWIAGKAYVMVPAAFGASADPMTPQQYREGESISYRGQQAAYLVPGECLVGVGHNPMTKEEYQRLTDDDDSNGRIDLTINPTIGDLRITYYVKRALPYRWAKVNYGGTSEDRYYLFLNFDGADKASEYAARYYSLMHEVIESRMGTFTGSILINKSKKYLEDHFHTTGISIYCENRKPEVIGETVSAFSADIVDRQYSCKGRYEGLLYALDESSVGLSTSAPLTGRIVDREVLRCITGDVDFGAGTGAASGLRMKLYVGTPDPVTGKRNVTLTRDAAGIIIVDGDVVINSCRFYGLVIAGGSITVMGNGSAERSDEVIEAAVAFDGVPYTDASGSSITLAGLFMPMITGHEISMREGASGYSPDLIDMRCSNWRKN